MPNQPSFYSDKSWPRKTDSFHVLLLKFWGLIIDAGYSTTNPVRTSTNWTALKRIGDAFSRQAENKWTPSITDTQHVLLKKIAYTANIATPAYTTPTKELTNRELLFNLAKQMSTPNIGYRDAEWNILYKIVHNLYFIVHP